LLLKEAALTTAEALSALKAEMCEAAAICVLLWLLKEEAMFALPSAFAWLLWVWIWVWEAAATVKEETFEF
jgi:hypothetical protein